MVRCLPHQGSETYESPVQRDARTAILGAPSRRRRQAEQDQGTEDHQIPYMLHLNPAVGSGFVELRGVYLPFDDGREVWT